jgi:hypothetical protein
MPKYRVSRVETIVVTYEVEAPHLMAAEVLIKPVAVKLEVPPGTQLLEAYANGHFNGFPYDADERRQMELAQWEAPNRYRNLMES